MKTIFAVLSLVLLSSLSACAPDYMSHDYDVVACNDGVPPEGAIKSWNIPQNAYDHDLFNANLPAARRPLFCIDYSGK